MWSTVTGIGIGIAIPIPILQPFYNTNNNSNQKQRIYTIRRISFVSMLLRERRTLQICCWMFRCG